MNLYIVVFDCGDQEWCDSIEEARDRTAEHGFDCGWIIYQATHIEQSPDPEPEG